jgi:hypothetical protein
MTVLVVLEGFVILVLAVLVVGLLRSHAEILRSLHDLGAGEGGSHDTQDTPRVREGLAKPKAGSIDAVDVAGVRPGGGAGKVTLVGPQPTLLAFMSSGCSTCASFWDAFSSGVDLPDDSARLVIVTRGPDRESESAIERLAPNQHQVLMSSDAWEDYDVPVSPYFVLIDGDGSVLGDGAAANWTQLVKLMSEAVSDQRSTSHRARHERIDQDLAQAGIEPDDPSLWDGESGSSP